MQKPLVTVLCITYNHEMFIRPCLESLVSQRCDFPFEIIVHDDASTDGTQAIIREFQEQYPELIKPILQKENQWSKNPGILDFFYKNPLLSGTYIALCEGDDFWIGKDKLQKQVAVLQEYPACTVTCSAYMLIDQGKEKVVLQDKWQTKNQENEKGRLFELNDLSETFFIKTSTALFRNSPELFDELKKFEFCLDMHLFYLLLKKGNGFYSKEVMAGYNRHEEGVYSGGTSQEILLAQYLILKDIYMKVGDEFFRRQYLKLTMPLINLKISGLMRNKHLNQKFLKTRNLSVSKIIKDIKPVLQTKAEYKAFYKSLIPMQVKSLKQKLKRSL